MLRGRAPEKPIAEVSFLSCPAKTYVRQHDGVTIPGRDVTAHCTIVGEVAKALIERIPEALRRALIPDGSPLVAAAHDIGKVSPCFYEKIRTACGDGTQDWITLGVDPAIERQWGGHAGVSQVAAAAIRAPRWIPEIVGQHHGFSPPVDGRSADGEIFGGPSWQLQREALVLELKHRLGMDWPIIELPEQARLIAGLTSVSDWVGSGKRFEDPSGPWEGNIDAALDEAGFVPPTFKRGLSFQNIFGFDPRPTQTSLIEAVRGPGVYVLEAPMGSGKTEAALYAAYCVLREDAARGIYFALPTQLTSEKIHERFGDFLSRIVADDCSHRDALLLHGKAWLKSGEMGEEGRPGGSWFSQKKRGLLAPFAVGTIDQALMAAMNVKHGFVRAFGLAGKVVILDEVHTYDAYTGTLLDALINLLRELHCTVIVLSATLSSSRRCELAGVDSSSCDYPLITAKPRADPAFEVRIHAAQSADVKVRTTPDEPEAIREALERAAGGQQVLWIENTVKDAQAAYLAVAARASELGVEVGLLHSRFSARDRSAIEARWVNLYGKPGWQRRQERGRILIGTQVLEQSIDIDADFLITRISPTDMLLQRLGRLWRHSNCPRVGGASREAWIIAPELEPAVEEAYAAFGSSAYVYSAYVLCRTLEVWRNRTKVTLPAEIRGLIEDTYVDRTEVGAWAKWLWELEEGTPRNKGRKALRQLARIGLATHGKTLPESHAQTRYSETDSCDVLLLRAIEPLPAQRASRLTLLDGSLVVVPWLRHRLSKLEWKEITIQLTQEIVPARPHDGPDALPRGLLEKLGLHHCFFLGDPNWPDDDTSFRIAVVDEASSIRDIRGSQANAKYHLRYRADLGYQAKKR